ncbi:hypothetical protein AAF712_008465 [Marasmius tenuissimus]|uniref:Uncharacterized protein n=1 Tax=Marasmius tenuissimus TaxID=585030 RepID=A0ABR2ZWG4_9AGAR
MSSDDDYQPSEKDTQVLAEDTESYPTHPMFVQGSSNASLDIISALDPPKNMVLGSLLTMEQWHGMISELLIDARARAEQMLERLYGEQPHRRPRDTVEERSRSLAIEQALNAVRFRLMRAPAPFCPATHLSPAAVHDLSWLYVCAVVEGNQDLDYGKECMHETFHPFLPNRPPIIELLRMDPEHVASFEFGPNVEDTEALNMMKTGGTAGLIPEFKLDAADPGGSWDTAIELNSEDEKDANSPQNSLVPGVARPRKQAKQRPKKVNSSENPFDSVFLKPEEVPIGLEYPPRPDIPLELAMGLTPSRQGPLPPGPSSRRGRSPQHHLEFDCVELSARIRNPRSTGGSGTDEPIINRLFLPGSTPTPEPYYPDGEGFGLPDEHLLPSTRQCPTDDTNITSDLTLLQQNDFVGPEAPHVEPEVVPGGDHAPSSSSPVPPPAQQTLLLTRIQRLELDVQGLSERNATLEQLGQQNERDLAESQNLQADNARLTTRIQTLELEVQRLSERNVTLERLGQTEQNLTEENQNFRTENTRLTTLLRDNEQHMMTVRQCHDQDLQDMRTRNDNLTAQVQQHLRADQDRTDSVEQLVEERTCSFLTYSNMRFELADVPHLIHVTERGVAASAGPVLNIILGMANQQVINVQRITDKVTRYETNFEHVPRPRGPLEPPMTSQNEGYSPERAMQEVASLSNVMGTFAQRAQNSYESVMGETSRQSDRNFLQEHGSTLQHALRRTAMLSPGSWVPRMIRDSEGLVDDALLNSYRSTEGSNKRKDRDGDKENVEGPRKK